MLLTVWSPELEREAANGGALTLTALEPDTVCGAAGPSAVFAGADLLLGEEVLRSGRRLVMEGAGGCMWPSIRAGDLLTVEPAATGDVSVGDIIVFRQGPRLVAHRLIRRRGMGCNVVLVAQGDGSRSPDEPIAAQRLLGKVVRLQRDGRMYELEGLTARLASLLFARLLPMAPWLRGPLAMAWRIGRRVLRRQRPDGRGATRPAESAGRFVPDDEASLLLHCCRCGSPDWEPPHLASRLPGIDWDRLLRLAEENGVRPLLHRALAAADSRYVPQAVRQRLQQAVRENTIRSMVLTAELARVLKALEAQGTQAVAYKGPALAVIAYGDAALREYVDLDILVRKGDMGRAERVLMGEGYAPWEEITGTAGCSPRDNHAVLIHRKSGIHLELHWRLAQHYSPPVVDLAGIWDRLEHVDLMGTPASSLRAEDLLLALCAHAMKHGWDQLSLVCDLAGLVRARPGMEWDAVLDHAAQKGGRRNLLLGMALAEELLGAAIPATMKREIVSDAAVMAIKPRVMGRMFDAAARLGVLVNLYTFRLLDCRRDRAIYFLGLLLHIVTPNTDDRTAMLLPRPLRGLHYILRPIRLVVTYGPQVLRRMVTRRRSPTGGRAAQRPVG